jgi:hypothetical protein
MKHLFIALFLLLNISNTTANDAPIVEEASEKELIDNKIYFFAHSMCHSCRDAFIYFQTYHKDLNIPIADMKYSSNLNLYKQCVKKFNIKNQELRLPLICMKNNYIMGWEKYSEQQFEQALKEFNLK